MGSILWSSKPYTHMGPRFLVNWSLEALYKQRRESGSCGWQVLASLFQSFCLLMLIKGRKTFILYLGNSQSLSLFGNLLLLSEKEHFVLGLYLWYSGFTPGLLKDHSWCAQGDARDRTQVIHLQGKQRPNQLYYCSCPYFLFSWFWGYTLQDSGV